MVAAEVNPALAAHGGFVTYVGHDGEGTAYMTMGGGCHGCSMSKMTMLDGVQTMLSEAIPAVAARARPHRSLHRREPVLLVSDAGTVSVTGLDHIVLRCGDVETTLAWYSELLGLAPVRVDEWRAGSGRRFRRCGSTPSTIIDFIGGRDGSLGHLDHLCLVVEPTDLQALADSGRFEVLDGPDTRYGARGNGTSLYVRDPDGLTVELRHYSA